MTSANKYHIVFDTIPEFCKVYKFDYEKIQPNYAYVIKKDGMIVAEIVNPLKFGPYAHLSGGACVPFFHHDGRKVSVYHAERRLHLFFEMLADRTTPLEIENRLRLDIQETGR